MSADIHQLPVVERSCVDCVHFRATERDTRCAVFDVQILSERIAARDCDAYQFEGDDDVAG